MSIRKKPQTDQSLSEKANAAFIKASEDVVEKATLTGTDVIVWRDNQIVRLPADEAAILIKERQRNCAQRKSV